MCILCILVSVNILMSWLLLINYFNLPLVSGSSLVIHCCFPPDQKESCRFSSPPFPPSSLHMFLSFTQRELLNGEPYPEECRGNSEGTAPPRVPPRQWPPHVWEVIHHAMIMASCFIGIRNREPDHGSNGMWDLPEFSTLSVSRRKCILLKCVC